MFQKIDPKELEKNVFSLLDDQWAVISAGSEAKFNSMTASWGGFGVLFHRPVATIYIRPQRYTMEFIERHPEFTLSFFPEEYRKQLTLFGRKSGRDTDKIRESGMTPIMASDNAPYYEEAELVLVCRKIYRGDLLPENFQDAAILTEFYPEKDYHRMLIGEITQALIKK